MTSWRISWFCVSMVLGGWFNHAHSHEGHGLEGVHAHPSDVWGLVALGVIAGVTAWLSRKK
jgi:hypothetical protein